MPNITGDDLAIEDERFRAYLVSRGWNEEMGEDDLKALAGEGVPSEIMEKDEGHRSLEGPVIVR